MHEQDCSEIIEKYGDLVYRIAFNQTKRKEEADDVFQEVFLRLMKNLHKLQDEQHIKAWLIRTTINCSKDTFLNAFRKHTTELVDVPYMDEKNSEVYYAVLELPVKYRRVIHLFYYEGYSLHEIADILKMNENTVKTQLSRAREILKKKLEGEMNDVGR